MRQLLSAKVAAALALIALGALEVAHGATHCAAFVQRLPNLTAQLCASSQLKASRAQTVRGVPIYVRDVLPTPEPEANPAETPVLPRLRVLVLGAIHGDELSSASVVFHWIRTATVGGAMGTSPANLPGVEWRFVPVLNADGALSPKPTRVNANGVDLNRNFPTPNWAREAKLYWEGRTKKDPRRWPGPKPLSEPESRFVYDQIGSFEPNLIVSVHAPYGVLDFDGPSVAPSRLGRLYLDQVGIFPGSLGNYGGVHKGVPVVTVELPNSMRTPLDAEMRQMWLDLLRWMGERVMQPKPAP